MVRHASSPISQSADPIPFRLRIGVTGHRQLPENTDWPERIAEALELIKGRLAPAGDTPLAWLAISSLAEGADRLVAEALLARPGSLMEVPLPLPRDEYQTDFKSDESKATFGRLYDQASLIINPPRFESRDSAYEWAGHVMVARSDVVIALWDGLATRGVGGTADIVKVARRHGRPVVHIPTGSGQAIQVLHPFAEGRPSSSSMDREQASSRGDSLAELVATADPFTLLRRSLRGMEAYNRIDIGADRIATARERARIDLMKWITTPEGKAIWEPIASWLVPRYATADLLAQAARGRVKWLLAITFTFPVLAIATVAVQSQFLPNLRWLLWAEVAFLIVIPVLMGFDRISRFHPDRAEKKARRRRLPMSAQQQWVSCRHLAELLRSAFFLAAVESPQARDAEQEPSGAEEEYCEAGAMDIQPPRIDASPIQGFHESAEGWLPRLH